MESIDDKILKSIKKRGRGLVFSTEEYAHYGAPEAVQKALSRMARKGVLLNVCHGIYCYPHIDKELGLRMLYPSFEDIAQGIAKRDKVVNIKNGRGIPFRRVSPKKLAFYDKLAMLITTALRNLGEKNVTDEHKDQLKKVLGQHSEPFSTHDMKLMPLWIRNI